MRIKEGVVTSAKMQKTVVVTVHGYRVHPVYQKKYRVSKRFMAHDEAGTCKEGDKVSIVETRPLSKNKRWRVVTAAEVAQIAKESKKTEVAQATTPDEIITATFEPRTRTKSRGVRMKEKSAPAEEAPAAPAPEQPTA